MRRFPWLGLCLLVVLHTFMAHAQEEGEESECRVVQQDGGTPRLEPEGELSSKECSGKWCVGTNYFYMGFSHSLTCLYVTDKKGVPTGTTSLGNDLEGLKTIRFVSDNLIELSFSTKDGSWVQRYEVDARGRVTPQRPPPPPPLSAAERRKQEVQKKKQQEEWARREALRAQSSCSSLQSDPHCAGQEPEGAVKTSLAQACGVPEERVKGVCSKTGCMGVIHQNPGGSNPLEYCVAWARTGKLPVVLPYSWGKLNEVFLEGSRVCLSMSQECNGWTAFGTEECADVSGPVARWVREPPGDTSGNANYEVLPYKGEAPRIDGKAQELEWKAPTLWINTAALVREGLETWGGPKDASAEWIVRSRGEELLFLLRVHDDQVVAGETSAQNDAVGLSVDKDGGQGGVRFILAPKGQVKTPGAAHARCAWSVAAGGYRMECAVPLAELGIPRPPVGWRAQVGVEDRDGPGKPLKKLGTRNLFISWSEFPPSWDEAARLASWDPCQLGDGD